MPATRSAAPPRAGNVYSGLGEQVAGFASLPSPPVVVFQDLDDPVAAATFGEIMCTTYKTFGAVGLITSGGGRDLDQVESLKFPCFTSGSICAHGYCQIVQVGVPVHVGGVHLTRSPQLSVTHAVSARVITSPNTRRSPQVTRRDQGSH